MYAHIWRRFLVCKTLVFSQQIVSENLLWARQLAGQSFMFYCILPCITHNFCRWPLYAGIIVTYPIHTKMWVRIVHGKIHFIKALFPKIGGLRWLPHTNVSCLEGKPDTFGMGVVDETLQTSVRFVKIEQVLLKKKSWECFQQVI